MTGPFPLFAIVNQVGGFYRLELPLQLPIFALDAGPGWPLGHRVGVEAHKAPFSRATGEKSLMQGLEPTMTRMGILSNPLLLGFEEIERLVDRAGKGADGGYPPYNIERIAVGDGSPELLRITLAVAGFTSEQLDITLEDNQLTIRGRQQDERPRDFLYRGIAARQFQRTFVLAEGIEVKKANLVNGLLSIDLVRLEPEKTIRRIDIGNGKP